MGSAFALKPSAVEVLRGASIYAGDGLDTSARGNSEPVPGPGVQSGDLVQAGSLKDSPTIFYDCRAFGRCACGAFSTFCVLPFRGVGLTSAGEVRF